MKKLLSLAVAAVVSLGAASSAYAAGSAPDSRGGDQAIEVVVVKAKRLRPERNDVVAMPKRPSVRVDAPSASAIPIEMPRFDFPTAAPVVRL